MYKLSIEYFEDNGYIYAATAWNDGDDLWAGVTVVGKRYWAGSVLVSYARDGEKTVGSRWRDTDSGNVRGLPYDYLFDGTESRQYYCTELIRDCWLHKLPELAGKKTLPPDVLTEIGLTIVHNSEEWK